jgi:hypothetical protein
MGKRTFQPLPKDVDRLKLQVLDWRRIKSSPGSPMAGELWDAAIHLAKRFGVCRVARAVGLDYGWLRKKVEKANAQALSVSTAFLELPLGRVVATAEGQFREPEGDSKPGRVLDSGPIIELSTPDGARMRIRLEAGTDLDAAGLVAAFLGRRL